MVELAVMIEGQHGLTWPRWQAIARLVEDAGFAGLYRSDHITNPGPPDLDSLELWVSLTWLAANTQRIQFGPLVSPASIRHPVITARMAAAVDDLSGGRLTLGMGAGWLEREHRNFGFELGDFAVRFARLQEALEVVTQLLRSDTPVTFKGAHYNLEEAILLPRPQRPSGPSILIGGNGALRTLPLAARYASEWNAVFIPAARYAELNSRLDALLQKEGRAPQALRRSLMTGLIFGRDEGEFQRKLGDRSADALRERGLVVGTPSHVVEQLGRLADAGAQRVMLQWLDVEDLSGLEALGASVLPQIRS